MLPPEILRDMYLPKALRTYATDTYFIIRVWSALYGFESVFLHLFACSQVWCMTHQLVGSQECDLFKAFRESEIAACNAVAVAGTLIATIAITSMALPSVGQVHWIVRSLWLLSLVAGLVSVLCACNLQTTICRNLSWKRLRGWLNDERDKTRRRGGTCATGENCKSGDVFYVPDFSAVLLISAPRVLIHYALSAYLIGLGVYLGFVWREELGSEGAAGDNQNAFIFFATSLSIFYPLYWLSSLGNKCKNAAYEGHWRKLNGVRKVGGRVEDVNESHDYMCQTA
ncbi:hypothetical protein EDB80DRAFT_181777 [Ilyonectria destructans]|nr:hypothetical protein EDB80DRAFT_181777 [Ilyonectria destructans]